MRLEDSPSGYHMAKNCNEPPEIDSVVTLKMTFSVTMFSSNSDESSIVASGVASCQISLAAKSDTSVAARIPVGLVAVPTEISPPVPVESEALAEADGDIDADGDTEAENEDEALADGLTLAEGESEALGL